MPELQQSQIRTKSKLLATLSATFCLIFSFEPITLAQTAPSEEISAHLPNSDLVVLNYDLDVEVPSIDAPILSARAVLEIKAIHPYSAIRLHIDSRRLSIATVSIDGTQTPFSVIIRDRNRYDLSGDVLKIETPSTVAVGESHSVSLSYSILVNQSAQDNGKRLVQEGFFYEPNYYGIKVLSTRSWPYYARSWLPSNDHPSNPATISYTLHVPSGVTAVANGALQMRPYVDNNSHGEPLITYRWSQSAPIPTYAFSVVVGSFKTRSDEDCYEIGRINSDIVPCGVGSHGKLAILYYADLLPDRQLFFTEFDKARHARVWFSSMLGEYPFDKLGFITAPHPFNMEHASLITLVSPSSAVHEVVHQWWGDSVYIESWGDFWINEGFATYLTGLYDEHIAGIDTSCRTTEGVLNLPSDTDPMDDFNRTPYCKGAGALHALRGLMANLAVSDIDSDVAKNIFFAVLKSTYQTFKGRALTTRGFYEHLQRIVPAILESHGISVDKQQVLRDLTEWKESWFSPF